MKKIENLEIEKKVFEDYFKEDLDAIEEELEKSKAYSAIIDEEIKKISTSTAGMGVNKGGTHYLIEHLTNAVQLQAQRQGLRKDRVAIKKAILDYTAKFASQDTDGKDENELNDLLKAFLENPNKK